MKHKCIGIALVTVLLGMVLGNSIACTTVVIEYHLTVTSTEGGKVTEPGEDRYPYCQEQGLAVDLVATPDPGYRFVEWTGDVGTIFDVDDPTTTMTVNDDYSITANFAKQHSLTISSTEGGSVTTPGEGTFPYHDGTVVNLVATANSGYYFINWTGDVSTITNVNAPTTTITINDNYSVTANFEQIPTGKVALTTSSTVGGSVTTPGEGAFTYDGGTVVDLAAEAGEGYRFVNWTGDVSTVANVNAASTNITMHGDYSLMANFEELAEYDLTTSSTTGGSVTAPGEGTFPYYDGTAVNLVARANSGYYFINWTGDVSTITNVNAPTTTITMNDNYSVTANFEQIPTGKVALTTSSTVGGSVTTPGEGPFTYDEGTVVDLVAEAEEGYRFVNWTGDVGTIAGVNSSSTTISMNDDYDIAANFQEIPKYELIISSTGGGSVTDPGEGSYSYDEGEVVNLVAEAIPGYQFVNWTGDVGTINNVNAASTTITMNDDHTITANFVDP